MDQQKANVLLEAKDLKVDFILDEGTVRAVNNVSLTVKRGKTLGMIGESGCGKSVTAQSILRVVPSPPGRIVGGSILLYAMNGDASVDIASLDPKGKAIREIRGREISMIFQEPMTSFSPVHTVGNQIGEALILHRRFSSEKARQESISALARVGIPKPEQRVDEYPYQLSGGMRQRAMIAMALSCSPRLLIADEPTTALDVTIQAQILELLRKLQDEEGMAMLIITHNLGIVAEMAEDVVVMYFGYAVEYGDVNQIFEAPLHPYTRCLWDAIPSIDKKSDRELTTIKGNVPDPFSEFAGCPFFERCPEAMPERCELSPPPLVEVVAGHRVRCFLYEVKANG